MHFEAETETVLFNILKSSMMDQVCINWKTDEFHPDIDSSIRTQLSIKVFIYVYIIIIISTQPLGQFGPEPEASQATGMAPVRCILGKFLGVVCHCFPPRLDVPTFAAYIFIRTIFH
jgi:hypothetical protein